MTTNAEFVNLSPKRLLGTEDFRDRWFGFMRETIREGMERAFRVGGVYDSAIGLAGDGANKIRLTGLQAVTDGDGHFMDPSLAPNSGLQFENAVGITYEVGLHYTTKPDGVQINPRTGFPEYERELETIGERAEPDAVVDNGNGTITFTVNSVTEAGVSNAGRQVMVFRKSPAKDGTLPGVAIETRSVVWSGGANKITTTGDLGQGAAISTTASDYEVILLGPTIWRNGSVSSSGEHAFLGTVTGNGGTPATFNTASQNVIDFSLSDIGDITKRDPVSGHVKIDVKSFATDSIKAITVRDTAGAPVFEVDKNGNLWVKGTTTQENVVQVNSSETITNNLTAGDDDDVDSHTIRGDWSHKVAANTKFYVDGSTGRVGIGGFDAAGYSLNITGKTRVNDDIEPDVNGGAALGTPTKRFSDLYVINLSFSGDFLPAVDNSQDIGSSVRRWAEGHYSQGIAIGDGNNPPAARVHIDSTSTPAIRIERSDVSGGSDIQLDSNGNLNVSKPDTGYFVFWPLGGTDAQNPFWRGFHFSGPTVTQGGSPRYGRVSVHQRSTTLTDPTDLEYHFQVGNLGTLNGGFRFETANQGEFAFRTGAGGEQMRIATNWVGIGATTPDANSYRMLVQGTWAGAVAQNQLVGYFSGQYGAADTGLKMGLGGYAASTHPSGTIQTLVGTSGVVQVAGGGNVTTSASFRAQNYDTGGGVATNAIGYWVEAFTGSPTNVYGVYVNAQTIGTSSNWAVYTAGTTPSYFGGALTMGSGFGVTGTATFNSAISVLNGSNITLSANSDIVGATGATGTEFTGAFLTLDPGAHSSTLSYGTTQFDRPNARLITTSGRSGIIVDVANDFLEPSLKNPAFGVVFPFADSTNSDDQVNWTAFGVWSGGTSPTRQLQIGKWGQIDVHPDLVPATNVGPSPSTNRISIAGGSSGRAVWSVQNGSGRVNFTWNCDYESSTWKVHAGGENPARMLMDGGGFTFYTLSGTTPASDGDAVPGWNSTLVISQANNRCEFGGSSSCYASSSQIQVSANTYMIDGTLNAYSNVYLAYNSGNPVLNFDANDYILYYRGNNWMDFYAAGTHGMRINVNGVEVGNGLSVGNYVAPETDSVKIIGATYTHLTIGTMTTVPSAPTGYSYSDANIWMGGSDRQSINAYDTSSDTNGGIELIARKGLYWDGQKHSRLQLDRSTNTGGLYDSMDWMAGYDSIFTMQANWCGLFQYSSIDHYLSIHSNPTSTHPGGTSALAKFYARDYTLSPWTTEMWVVDDGGSASQLSAHCPMTNEYFVNTYCGERDVTVKIWLERLVAAVEALTGEKFSVISQGDTTSVAEMPPA